MNLELTQILIAVLNVIVIPGVGAIILYFVNKRVKDQQLRDLLTTAVKNSVGLAEDTANATIRSLKPSISVPGVPEEFAPNVQYVLDHAGEAVKRFGVTPFSIFEKVNTQVGLLKMTAPAKLNPVPPRKDIPIRRAPKKKPAARFIPRQR